MTSSPFLNDIRRFMRTRGYSLRTEKTCVYWIRFFIRYQKRRHPKEMGFHQYSGRQTSDRACCTEFARPAAVRCEY
ncbi:phage integrase N-terminal SAM-like domain-containing protein [Oceanobacter sp. 5_MG-2023]|uniref:phage integrase N-terminal SAM-like domain-containing protein n=1 Tax=Oceanobacter sp. 5_MG-2023 TaxID=3062645 RepID=UPI0034C62D16